MAKRLSTVFHSLIFVLCLVGFLSVKLPQPRFQLDFYWFWLAGFLAIVLGLAIYVWAKLQLKNDGLVTAGPYHFVRHPQYLGIIFILIGWWWVWAAVYAFYYGLFIISAIWLVAYLEEKLILVKSFGDQFQQYRQQTGMFWFK